MYNIQFLKDTTNQEVVSLRKQSFLKYYGSNVNLEMLDWNETDRQSYHLGCFQNNKLISYLRITLFKDATTLENSTKISTPKTTIFPVALLARAATDEMHINIGLHSVLRCVALEFCKINLIDTVFGSLESRSRRLNQLYNVGYEVVNSVENWNNGYIKNMGSVSLIMLTGKDKIQSAINNLNKENKIDFNKINWPTDLLYR
jgi:hypothetical protein